MISIQSDKVYFFDCDDTLVMWNDNDSFAEHAEGVIKFEDPYFTEKTHGYQKYVYLKPNHPMIASLKYYGKIKHKIVIVWSAGGWKWARNVVMGLDLMDYVHFCMSKPLKHFDDLPCDKFMGEWVHPNQGYLGRGNILP